MNDHWLKNKYKDLTTDELTDQHNRLMLFGGNPIEIGMMTAEIGRREREIKGALEAFQALIQEDTP